MVGLTEKTLGPSTLPDRTRDDYAACALGAQNAARQAVQLVRSNSVIRDSQWASPLVAAPSAVGTMAILFKTSSAKAAAGLKLETRDVRDGKGVKIDTLALVLLPFICVVS